MRRCVLIGEGESRESLQQQVDQLGLRERVLFAGWRHDTGDWLRAFDLFALSSISEALPLALLEAMASGLPVLATAVGDVTDIVNQAGCGLSVPVGDDLGYARALRELLADRERRLAFGLRAREYAVAHHSIDAMVGEYLTAYRFS